MCSSDLGIFGNAHIVAGGSSTTSVSPPSSQIANWTVNGSVGSNTTAASNFTNGQTTNTSIGFYRRRQNNLMTYETPNLWGFQVMGSMTMRNYASAATGNMFNSRLYSVGATYSNGPLFIGAAYEKHKAFYDQNNGAASATATGTGQLPNTPVPGDDQIGRAHV